MQPKRILLLGWDALAMMGGSGFKELVAIRPVSDRRRRTRLLQSGQIEGIPAFAIPHPSAAWKNPPVTDDDWEMIAAEIAAASAV
jgi:uracil-DNA glycosylase